MMKRILTIAAGAATIVLLTALITTAVTARNLAPPGDDSVDVGFARDMSAHHAQAVEMAELIRGRTEDARIAAMASDIALTQQAQLGRMQGWLALWDQPQTVVGPRMAWMGHPVDGPMPGMATRAELTTLAESEGEDAERLFLELMIDHHLAGIDMANMAAAEAAVPDVRRLAEAMAAGQEAEVDALRALLSERRTEPDGSA